MFNQKLKNKVIVVTGGSGGIGNTIVNKLASYETNVVSVFNQNPPSDPSYSNILWLQADVTNPDNIDKLLTFTLQKFERIDILINSAGILKPGDFSSLDINQLKKMIDVNFTSTLLITQKVLSIMKSQRIGHIINIGSLGGIVPMPYSAVYSATKFALRGFSLSLFEELKGTNVKLSLITPGSVITKMLDYEAEADNSAISFLSEPISPIEVADTVFRVIQKPRIEKIIPYNQSFGSKLLVMSPKLFSVAYRFLHRIGLSGKRKYLNRYCNFSLLRGASR